MKLRTSDDNYREAAKLINKGRGKTVTIPRKLFVNLVLDHSTLCELAISCNEGIEYGND